ncbi:MAG: sugar ABC transporter permease [Verrucomicrobia bacterium]|nr:sugar ABC transporter permease [Verrucomicrobiota bacterium]
MTTNQPSRFPAYAKSYLMIAPFFILFGIFTLGPMLYGIAISFTKWNGINSPTFVGLNNYATVIDSPRFAKAFSNLLLYVAITVPFGITLAFCVALVVNRFKGLTAHFFRSAYFLPTVIPLFLTAVIWRWLLTPDFGLINMGLTLVRLPQPNWLGDPPYMIPALVMADAWRATGFNMVIFLAGMKNIPNEYYEAATIDGANAFAKIRFIMMPALGSVFLLVIVNAVISALQVFDLPWLMTNSSFSGYGGPLQGMLFPVMDVMGRGFGGRRFGEASAIAAILFLLILTITIIQLAIRRRWREL